IWGKNWGLVLSTNMRGLALLGDLETHAVDYSTSMIRFLQPWAHQGLTPKQWQDLETVIRHYLSKFILLMNKVIKDEGEHREYGAVPTPSSFVTQFSLGCELHPNGTSRQFCDAAVNGEDFVSFSVDMGTWVAQRGEKMACSIRDLFNEDNSTNAMVQFLLRTTCVNELKSFVQHGKESLERQGEAGHHSPLTEMQPLLGRDAGGLFKQGPLVWCTNAAMSGLEHSSDFIAMLHSSLGQEVKGDSVTAGNCRGQN
uniref:MHC class I-like antigen recognition-like domain-containing protein n=1 Tax=Chelydra serpentina TaxID=8475 RepID=A0A8C3SPJ5_CHESE